MPIASPPGVSWVKVQEGPNEIELSWFPGGRTPRRDPAGFVFLAVWLTIWGFAMYSLVQQLKASPGGTGSVALILFMTVWSLGGLMAVRQMMKRAVPARPEKITLRGFEMHHDLGERLNTGPGRVRWREATIDRTDLKLNFNEMTTPPQLTYDHETGQVEIGPGLPVEDLVYLHDTIAHWQEQGGV